MTSDNHTEILPNLLLCLSIIFLVSKVLNLGLNKLKLPSVLGELFAGLLIGIILLFLPEKSFLSEIFNLIKTSEVLFIMGEIGIILLLFEVGLETELSKIVSVGKEAILVALGGVLAPFSLVYLFNSIFKYNWSNDLTLYIGLVLAATSIGVTARVFQDLKILHTKNSQIVLGAAVIDDVIGLILLSVIMGIVKEKTQTISILNTLFIIIKAISFLGLSIWFGNKFTKKVIPLFTELSRKDPLSLLCWSLVFCFIFAYLGYLMGLAPIIGAFAAGMALDRVELKGLFQETKKIEDFVKPVIAVLTPIFFVKVGLAIDIQSIFTSNLPIILTIIACISKLASGYLFLPFKTDINRLFIGVGMLPRGEVGLVIASLGHQMGLLSHILYSAILFAVVITTFIAPLWLQLIVKKQKP